MTQQELIQNQIDVANAQKTILTNQFNVKVAQIDVQIDKLNLDLAKTDEKTPAVFPAQQINPFQMSSR